MKSLFKKSLDNYFSIKDFNLKINGIEDKEGIYFVYTNNPIYINNYPLNKKLKSKCYNVSFLIKRFNLYCEDKKQILYIGSSGSLKTRIRNLYNTMYRNSLSHTGGSALSQIDNFNDLYLSYVYVGNCRDRETSELELFSAKKGFLPFANMRYW